MKKITTLVLVVVAFIFGVGFTKLVSISNSDEQAAAAILSTQKNTPNTTISKSIAVSATEPIETTTSTGRKLRITVINGQCVYQIRNWILGSWNIVQVSPYDTTVGACPGLQSVL